MNMLLLSVVMLAQFPTLGPEEPWSYKIEPHMVYKDSSRKGPKVSFHKNVERVWVSYKRSDLQGAKVWQSVGFIRFRTRENFEKEFETWYSKLNDAETAREKDRASQGWLNTAWEWKTKHFWYAQKYPNVYDPEKVFPSREKAAEHLRDNFRKGKTK